VVKLEWYGHSYVIVECEGGVRIAIDPHDGASLNLPSYRSKADYLLVTHDHFDHNAVEMVSVSGDIVRWRTGRINLGNVEVEGLPSYHDKSGGELRGSNTIYVISGRIRIAHLGDLGHPLTSDLREKLEGVDILILPVGGVYTIDAYEAWEIVKELNPKLVLPIHFWLPGSTMPLDPLERFLLTAKTRRLRVEGNSIEFSPEELPEKTTTIIFEKLPRR